MQRLQSFALAPSPFDGIPFEEVFGGETDGTDHTDGDDVTDHTDESDVTDLADTDSEEDSDDDDDDDDDDESVTTTDDVADTDEEATGGDSTANVRLHGGVTPSPTPPARLARRAGQASQASPLLLQLELAAAPMAVRTQLGAALW
jgi:hypothetical protein